MWTPCHHKGPCQREAGGSEMEKEAGRRYTAGVGGAGRGRPQTPEKARTPVLSSNLQRERSPATPSSLEFRPPELHNNTRVTPVCGRL